MQARILPVFAGYFVSSLGYFVNFPNPRNKARLENKGDLKLLMRLEDHIHWCEHALEGESLTLLERTTLQALLHEARYTALSETREQTRDRVLVVVQDMLEHLKKMTAAYSPDEVVQVALSAR